MSRNIHRLLHKSIDSDKKQTFYVYEDLGKFKQNLDNMKYLMTKNRYIPKVKNIDGTGPFVLNRLTGNVVSMPNQLSCQSTPTSSKIKVVITGSSGNFLC